MHQIKPFLVRLPLAEVRAIAAAVSAHRRGPLSSRTSQYGWFAGSGRQRSNGRQRSHERQRSNGFTAATGGSIATTGDE